MNIKGTTFELRSSHLFRDQLAVQRGFGRKVLGMQFHRQSFS